MDAMKSNAKQLNKNMTNMNDNMNAKFAAMMNSMNNFFGKRSSDETFDGNKRKKPDKEPFTTATAPSASNCTHDTLTGVNTVVDTNHHNHECPELVPTQCENADFGGEQDISQIELSHDQDQNTSFMSTANNTPTNDTGNNTTTLTQQESPKEPDNKVTHHRSPCWRLQR